MAVCPGQAWTAAFWFDLAAAPTQHGLVAPPAGLVWKYKAIRKSQTI